MHISVLLQEVLQAFEGCQLNTFVDGTFGAGGHARAILQAHPEIIQYFGFDQDPTVVAAAESLFEEKVKIIQSNFRWMRARLQEMGVDKISGCLLDLGVSSMQLDQKERGFSFMQDGPLDMRMNPNEGTTAEEIVNNYSEGDLARIFRDFGEEKHWRRAARAVIRRREEKPFSRTLDLANFLESALPYCKKHGATKCFQGLRIAVNRELEVLEAILPEVLDMLEPGGRLAVISFHSLEDRIVKKAFRYWASDKESSSGVGGLFIDKEPQAKLLTRRAWMPSEEEVQKNPRSRSARLRVIEKWQSS